MPSLTDRNRSISSFDNLQVLTHLRLICRQESFWIFLWTSNNKAILIPAYSHLECGTMLLIAFLMESMNEILLLMILHPDLFLFRFYSAYIHNSLFITYLFGTCQQWFPYICKFICLPFLASYLVPVFAFLCSRIFAVLILVFHLMSYYELTYRNWVHCNCTFHVYGCGHRRTRTGPYVRQPIHL